MKVNVEIFGQLTEITKNKRLTIESVDNTNDLFAKLYEQFPALRAASFVVAVNNNLVDKNTMLDDNFTIALMPPYAGG